MTRAEFLMEIETILESDSGTLTGTEVLSGLEMWDSLAVLSYIAMVDENFGINVPGRKVNECKTVNDLVVIVADKLTD